MQNDIKYIKTLCLLSLLALVNLVQAEIPLHEQTRELLKASNHVKPERLNTHPVNTVYNREAIIPPQCYTRTEGRYNPCYVCHQNAMPERENTMNDRELQEAYSFSDLGMENHWQNLFVDKLNQIEKISDQEIIDWINQDNYSDLAERLKKSNYRGWIPDLTGLEKGSEAFDEKGIAKDGSHWVVFNYKPFPSTFWPTNGSTDDVMIKLAKPFRENLAGNYVEDIYLANLAIIEANIKGLNKISSFPIDENLVAKDLNGDKQLGIINEITAVDQYVGAAEQYFIDQSLYPEGTEFLHSVRYLGFDKQGDIGVSTRMKELRYMKKWKAYPKSSLTRYYEEEAFEKEAGNLPGYTNLGDYGFDNGMGWSIQGFMENSQGRLRVNSFEENLFCMGCHGSIGATIDKTFSFARKIEGKQGWGYINLKGMPDVPTMGEKKGEFVTYFERVGGGDEFRSNTEMLSRWFNADGSVNYQAIAGKDVYQLITPSKQRALQLNKAYKILVDQQSYLYGRDSIVKPPANVHKKINNVTSKGLEKEFTYDWDIRLDWHKN